MGDFRWGYWILDGRYWILDMGYWLCFPHVGLGLSLLDAKQLGTGISQVETHN
ncbi:MAG: hypothetical protein KDC83_13985 [Flavobacteriales bacterium]|nr:hypothetical protein [Flavobacteriales bacterium]